MAANSLVGKKVLLVDDDTDILTAMSVAFNETGAEVMTATDGNKAVEVATQTPPDLVVLDMMLPKRSGFLVLEKIKPHRKAGSKPLVIMITGNPGKRHQAYAETLGVERYMNKPIRMERLVKEAEVLLLGAPQEP
jgi:two-component system OmpR family response regulator